MRYNKKNRYMLVGVEVMSRQVYAAPVKSKKAVDMKAAFRAIFDKMPALPWQIFSDRGTEFDSREMKEFYEQNDIGKMSAQNVETKASMAERMIRTIKHRLYRYFTQNRTMNWVDVIDRITEGINNTVNRSTGLKPSEFNFKNSTRLWKKLYGGVFGPGLQPKLKEGDVVRIAKGRKAFEKGYLPNYSNETYDITQVKSTRPATYKVKGSSGHPLEIGRAHV